jgi:hypothetical protein
MSLLRFLLLLSIKALAQLFYRFETGWVGARPKDRGWRDVRIGLLLNHTSLFEPLFAAVAPVTFLWRIASRGIFPVADITLERPIAGLALRVLAPDVVPLTRKRDESWDLFLEKLSEESVLIFLPEGRMKRPNGLDKHGRPMTVQGGVVEVLRAMGRGTVLLGYSGGLHHVQAPGQRFPRLFKTIKINFEAIDTAAYLAEFEGAERFERKKLTADLERRRDKHCPV